MFIFVSMYVDKQEQMYVSTLSMKNKVGIANRSSRRSIYFCEETIHDFDERWFLININIIAEIIAIQLNYDSK